MSAKEFAEAMESLQRGDDRTADLSQPFVNVFPVDGAAVSTLGDFLGSETISASDDQAARLDELQFDLGEGPCWDAMLSARPVLEPDLRSRADSAWPAFSAAIAGDDVGALFAFPVLLGPLRIGAVDLYSSEPIELDLTQTHQATTLAVAIGRQILRRALATASQEYAEDAGNRFSRRLIHQATGMVLAQLGISAEDAGLVIQGQAFATSRSMMEVADEIVSGRLNFSLEDRGIEDLTAEDPTVEVPTTTRGTIEDPT